MIERSIRAQLARLLGAGGFDPADDILAITVNRWPHGYTYQYNSLSDPFWLAGGEPPQIVARQRFERVAIANADAAAYASMQRSTRPIAPCTRFWTSGNGVSCPKSPARYATRTHLLPEWIRSIVL